MTYHIKTREFWLSRLVFFIGIWIFTVVVASFVIIVSTGGVNTAYWNTIQNIGIRGVFNFGSYIIIFSLLIDFLSTKLPYNGQKVWLRLLISLLFGTSIAYISANINALFPFPERMRAAQDDFLFIFIISFFQCGMIFTTLEIWEMIKRNRKLNSSITLLEKEKMQSQLIALRQQVNPHFLFNSLNVLSELIHENVDKSDQFLQHFAKVYRYVLEINQEVVVTLQKEFDFLNSYIFLQKIRFEDNLALEIDLPQEAMQKFVPPLSLQLLFENAIKHNVISAHTPLQIHIKSENNMLVIKNNFQELKTTIQSTGVGQKNLIKKYQLISKQLPNFYLKNGWYIAELPLLQLEQ